ncbi:MAG: hypothetical protein H6673_15790 [Anaerolineales bacterium]|nr:hypothetical protein [Anaerolineales bacterium]
MAARNTPDKPLSPDEINRKLSSIRKSIQHSPVLKQDEHPYVLTSLTDFVPPIIPSDIEEMADLIAHFGRFDESDIILSKADRSGGPLAHAVALRTDRPYTLARLHPGGVGWQVSSGTFMGFAENKQISVNGIKRGQKVIIVDDLLSSGDTVLSLVDAVNRVGASVIQAIFVYEKLEPKGRDKILEHNIEVITLARFSLHDNKVNFHIDGAVSAVRGRYSIFQMRKHHQKYESDIRADFTSIANIHGVSGNFHQIFGAYEGSPEPSYLIELKGNYDNILGFFADWGKSFEQEAVLISYYRALATGFREIYTVELLSDDEIDVFLKYIEEAELSVSGYKTERGFKFEYWGDSNVEQCEVDALHIYHLLKKATSRHVHVIREIDYQVEEISDYDPYIERSNLGRSSLITSLAKKYNLLQGTPPSLPTG